MLIVSEAQAIDLGLLRGCRGCERIVVLGPVRLCGRIARADPVLHRELARLQGRGRLVEFFAVDQHHRAGVADDEVEFVGDEPPVQRDRDRADLRGAEIGLDVLDAVHQQERNAIALAHALVAQHLGDAIGARIEFRVREAAVLFDLDDRFDLRAQVRPLRQEESEIRLHPGIIQDEVRVRSRCRSRWSPYH
jgi:hypothetical protein